MQCVSGVNEFFDLDVDIVSRPYELTSMSRKSLSLWSLFSSSPKCLGYMGMSSVAVFAACSADRLYPPFAFPSQTNCCTDHELEGDRAECHGMFMNYLIFHVHLFHIYISFVERFNDLQRRRCRIVQSLRLLKRLSVPLVEKTTEFEGKALLKANRIHKLFCSKLFSPSSLVIVTIRRR